MRLSASAAISYVALRWRFGPQDAWLRFLSRNGLTSFPMAASPG